MASSAAGKVGGSGVQALFAWLCQRVSLVHACMWAGGGGCHVSAGAPGLPACGAPAYVCLGVLPRSVMDQPFPV